MHDTDILVRTLDFTIGNMTIKDHSTIICGHIKTKLINNVLDQLNKHDPIIYNYINKTKTYKYNVIELANDLSKTYEIVEHRSICEQYPDPNDRCYKKLINAKAYIRPIVILIDNVLEHLNSDDYKSVDTIKTNLKRILSLAHKSNTYGILFESKIDSWINDLVDNVIDVNSYTIVHNIRDDVELECILPICKYDDNEDDDRIVRFDISYTERNLIQELEDSRFDSSNTSKDKKDIWIKYYRQARNSSRSNVIVESIKNGKFTITNDDKVLILPDIN